MWKSTSSSAFAGSVESPYIAAAAYTDSSSSEFPKASAHSRGPMGKQARGVCGFNIVEGFQSKESKSRQAEWVTLYDFVESNSVPLLPEGDLLTPQTLERGGMRFSNSQGEGGSL
jgi:hypothetical protein